MKAKMMALGLGLVLFASGKAHAFNGNFYLGGALSLQDCARIAGAANFQLAVFGPGFDHYGVYYPYLNACFGNGKKDGGGGGGGNDLNDYFFYPYVKTGYDIKGCIDDLKEVKGVWECSPWLGSSTYIMECEAKRRLTLKEAKAVANEMKSFKCVDIVDGPRDKRPQ